MRKTNFRVIVSLFFVLVIMMLISIFSSQSATKSLYISDFVGNLVINIKGDELSSTSKTPLLAGLNLRKFAHILLYMLLGFFSYFLIFEINGKGNKVFGINESWFSITGIEIKAMVVSFVYACMDEFHQLFVSGRKGLASDVFIDALGFVPAIIVTAYVMRYYKRKRDKGRDL